MKFHPIRKTILLVTLAAIMLLSACKIVSTNENPRETERTRQTTTAKTNRTQRTTEQQSSTTPRTTAATAIEEAPATTMGVAVTEAPYIDEVPATEPVEVPAYREPVIELIGFHLPELEDRFFLKELAGESMDVFMQVYSAIMAFESEVVFDEPITLDRMTNVMMLINYACPELMQVDCNYTYYTNAQNMCTSIEFCYILDVDTYIWACHQIRDTFDILRDQTHGMSMPEKERFAYELLIDVCTYDDTTLHSGTCFGAVLEGVARCEGYAKAFMWMMWALDIPCMTVTGATLEDDVRHAWNVVCIDGNYAIVDVTFDDVEDYGEQYPVPYAHFNVTDEFVANNRIMDTLYSILKKPACNNESMSFHVGNGSYCDDRTDPIDFFINQVLCTVEMGESRVYFQCASQQGFWDVVDAIDYILPEVLSSCLNGWGYNWYSYTDGQTIIVDLQY